MSVHVLFTPEAPLHQTYQFPFLLPHRHSERRTGPVLPKASPRHHCKSWESTRCCHGGHLTLLQWYRGATLDHVPDL